MVNLPQITAKGSNSSSGSTMEFWRLFMPLGYPNDFKVEDILHAKPKESVSERRISEKAFDTINLARVLLQSLLFLESGSFVLLWSDRPVSSWRLNRDCGTRDFTSLVLGR
jgi:hypothetical protein